MLKLDWDRWRRQGLWALGGALMLLGIALAGTGLTSGVAVAKQPAGGESPLSLFEAMMPVFTSPRCVNCHGGIDVASGDGHGGGAVAFATDKTGDMARDASAECVDCHTLGVQLVSNPGSPAEGGFDAVPPSVQSINTWRLAPQRMSLANKDASELCQQMVDQNSLDAGDPAQLDAFIAHASGDFLIGVGFDGRGGIGDSSPVGPISRDPPPMSREEFVAAATRWIADGHARCDSGGWNGKITVTLSTRSAEPGFDSADDWRAVVTVVSGQASTNVQYTAHENQDSGPGPGGGCATYRHITYSAEGRVPATFSVSFNRDLFPQGAPPGSPPEVQQLLDPKLYSVSVSIQPVSVKQHEEGVGKDCKSYVKDDQTTLDVNPGAPLQGMLDENDPNHLGGQVTTDLPLGTQTVQWDLTNDSP